MRWQLVLALLLGLTSRVCQSTCVFESDFGFTLNCAFKKSGIFRVRNLGGVKGYVGLGFSVGDELGFRQSLSTLESNRRRSTDTQAAPNIVTADSAEIAKTNAEGRMHNGRVKGLQGSRVVPPFRPLPPASPSAVRASAAIHNMRAPSLSQQPVVVVPAFQALPQSIVQAANSPMAPRQPAPQAFQSALQMANRRFQVVVPDMPSSNALPSSMAKPENAVPENTLTVRTLQSPPPQSKPTVVSTVDIHAPNPMLLGHSISSLAQASNISVETLAAAIKLKQEQLRVSITTTTTTTTTSTTPQPVVTRPSTVKPRYSLAGPSKVMNAPKEYYPVAYDKNYDDNFTSKVELPDTSFSCGDQKHFPGLYADEDLGCMVFHVCAFTDDGLVMKSFLCPESTLFDQTILKCNWWFYVDCKSSRKLYDSNIPISKSYQLMKALAFFSTYRNQTANAT